MGYDWLSFLGVPETKIGCLKLPIRPAPMASAPVPRVQWCLRLSGLSDDKSTDGNVFSIADQQLPSCDQVRTYSACLPLASRQKYQNLQVFGPGCSNRSLAEKLSAEIVPVCRSNHWDHFFATRVIYYMKVSAVACFTQVLRKGEPATILACGPENCMDFAWGKFVRSRYGPDNR